MVMVTVMVLGNYGKTTTQNEKQRSRKLRLFLFADSQIHVRQKKTATSEPKLFKTNVFSRQKAMRHTFRFSKQDSGKATPEKEGE